MLLSPYEGLKRETQRGIERSLGVKVEMLLNPYEGLKQDFSSLPGLSAAVEMLLNPYEGL